jgi:hypothetical protein
MKVPAGCTVILGVLLGCSPGDASEDQGGRPEMDDRAATSVASVDPGVPTVADWEALVRSLEFRVDSAEQVLVRIPNLTSRERSRLRADANARQTARATALGIPRGGAVEPLEERGRLRRLPESTRLWEIRDLDYSVPYVTPDAESMLVEIGERWMAALDSLGLPPFRMEITSVLRTPADQARLRRSNANAARGASSHEFGTTLDIAYRRYAAPRMGGTELENVHPSLRSRLETTHDSLFVELASRRGTELEAVLGRVIEEMRSEGKLLVMMERQQTVYHITVARRLPAREMSEVE